MGIFIRTVPNVMQHFGCSADTAQRYIDLRDEGYGREQAALMAGLSDPPESLPQQEREGGGRSDGVMASHAQHCGNCADGVPGGPENCSKCGHEQQYSHWTPRFQKTYCSQCGSEFGPGNQGYSHCEDHAPQGGKP